MNVGLEREVEEPGPGDLDRRPRRSRSAAATTSWATSRGLRPSALASGSAPFAWASARSDGRTTGSAPGAPATASNAGCSRAARRSRGSAIGAGHCAAAAVAIERRFATDRPTGTRLPAAAPLASVRRRPPPS